MSKTPAAKPKPAPAETKPFDVIVASTTRLRVYAESQDAAAAIVLKGGPIGVVIDSTEPQILDVLEVAQ